MGDTDLKRAALMMGRAGRQLLTVLLSLVLSLNTGCQPESPPGMQLQQDVYIWQRSWRPTHAAALQQSWQVFSRLRVLSLQFHRSAAGPVWTRTTPDWALLARDQRPVALVLRLDGQLSQLPAATAIWQQLQPQIDAARQAGVKLHGLEIDYDAASAALSAYRQWLQQLRPLLPPDWSFQITALPDWLQSEHYPALCQAADQLTLQLHSVLSPVQGLFDSNKAKQWTKSAVAKTPCPLFLALPAYHSAWIQTADGGRVESEMPLPIAGQRQALRSQPQAVADFLTWLQRQSFTRLRGLVWFRLPLSDDQRSWPWLTLQALLRGETLQAKLHTTLTSNQGRFDIQLHNSGNLSKELPDNLRFRGIQCIGGDAQQSYQWQQDGSDWWLQRQKHQADNPQLAPGQQLTVAWLRCRQLSISTATD